MSLTKGLVLHQMLDKESLQSATTFADKTPNENVGTKYGSVLKFDGGNDYVEVADNASLDITDEITISAWINLNTNNLMYLFDKRVGMADGTISVYIRNTGRAVLYINGAEVITTPDNLFTSSSGWTHILFTAKNNSLDNHIYKNGVDVSTASVAKPFQTNNANLLIGSLYSGGHYFDGSIGDTRFYSRALSAAEVLTMYQGGVVDDTDLEAHYKFGDKSGTTLLDETANSNDGTLTNFADTTAAYGNTHDSGWVTDDTPNVFALDRMGQADRAMSFDGASDYVDCGNGASLNFVDNNIFTMSAWFKTSDASTFKWIYHHGRQLVEKQRAIMVSSSNKASFYFADSGKDIYSTDTVVDGVWHNIVGTLDGTTAKLYLDSIFESSSEPNLTNYNYAGSHIGSEFSIFYFNGSLADVRIYNRALDQTEITMLYDMYRPKLSAGSLQKGLVFDMPLTSTYTKDETAGAEVMTDRTPYSNDGQNSGGDVDTDHTTFIAANSDYIRIPDSESLSPTSAMSAMTAMIWVKGDAQSSKGLLTHYDVGTNQRSYALNSGGYSPVNKFRIVISSDGLFSANHKVYESSIIAFDSTWHLIGFSFDAGTLKLYVDGVEDTNPTKYVDNATTTIHDSTADVMFGCYLNSDTPDSFFDGDISGAKIWNRALTDAEWLLAYEQTKGKFL